MDRYSLNENEERELKDYVESRYALHFRHFQELLQSFTRMNVEAYKIGSGECNNYPLLEHIADFGKPVILSTGMNTIESVKKQFKFL